MKKNNIFLNTFYKSTIFEVTTSLIPKPYFPVLFSEITRKDPFAGQCSAMQSL